MKNNDIESNWFNMISESMTNYSSGIHSFPAILRAATHLEQPIETYLTLLDSHFGLLTWITQNLKTVYHHKPLPLDENEYQTFSALIESWRLLAQAYEQASGNDEEVEDIPARKRHLLHSLSRQACCLRMVLQEFAAARIEPGSSVWLSLHALYQRAEDEQLQFEQVAMPFNLTDRMSIQAVYVELILIDTANVFALNPVEYTLVTEWAYKWSSYATIINTIPEEKKPKFIVHLLRDRAVVYDPEAVEHRNIRWLETSELNKKILTDLLQLSQNDNPVELGLTKDLNFRQICLPLLKRLRVPWSMESVSRAEQRESGQGLVSVSFGLNRIFDILTNGGYNNRLSAALDSWEILDFSPGGYRLQSDLLSVRAAQHQLVIITAEEDDDDHTLAQIRWLTQSRNGSVMIGVAIISRTVEILTIEEIPGSKGLLLEPLSLNNPNTNKSVILPSHSASIDSELTITMHNSTTPQKVVLGEFIRRGTGFDELELIFPDTQ